MERVLSTCAIAFLLGLGVCQAGEIHSNGLGGGPWSDPKTWHGNAVPAATDEVVVATGDTVAFDGNDDGKPSCVRLSVDMKGILTFKADKEKHTLSVGGSVESYGTIRMDATGTLLGSMELRLVSEAPEGRAIRLMEGSSFLGYGREGLPKGERNVILSTGEPAKDQPRRSATLVAGAKTMLDLQRTRLTDVIVQGVSIDNTGAKPNERLNIVDNRLGGLSQVVLTSCDTPLVQRNVFDNSAENVQTAIAINTYGCQLADIRGNTIGGKYGRGLQIQADIDSSATDNTVSASEIGIYWHGANAMIRNNAISGASTGVLFTSATGVLEGISVQGAAIGMDISSATVQLTDCEIAKLADKGTALNLNAASATLLNCNIAPEQIKLGPNPPTGVPWVQNMQYLVVQVKGAVPPQAQVEVRTAEVSGRPPKGAADLNVRNSPAKLSADGLTPLPRSLRPLIVRSWNIGANGQKGNAPFYDLMVSIPAAKAGEDSKVVKSQTIEPKDAWLRPEPNKPAATIEVTLP
jgi:hypothetical protein